jgi:hypothetical protein|tara:strand:- start:1486 stop:1707 length:222 start_codon:yes stop_codon:yes gene_type:complete
LDTRFIKLLIIGEKMKNTQHNPEIQLELPAMKTGFYVFMDKCAINFPGPEDLAEEPEQVANTTYPEIQLSLSV